MTTTTATTTTTTTEEEPRSSTLEPGLDRAEHIEIGAQPIAFLDLQWGQIPEGYLSLPSTPPRADGLDIGEGPIARSEAGQ
jgi:hypothetical protein